MCIRDSKGTYGTNGTPGWGILHKTDNTGSARSSHYACGQNTDTNATEIGYCDGPGSGGSWSNHLTSLSTGGAWPTTIAIGCAGSGADNSSSYRVKIWIR